jgi:hypothetical protein
MSDLLIRGMEMPKGCAFCRIGKRNGKKMVCPLCDEEWDIHDPMSADHRLDNCPLVPVPPHGDLIDKKTVSENLASVLNKKNPPFSYPDWNDAIVAMMTAPTIIPSSGGIEDE